VRGSAQCDGRSLATVGQNSGPSFSVGGPKYTMLHQFKGDIVVDNAVF